MSIRVMNEVWHRSNMEGGNLLVLLAIADNADDYGEAHPSVALIAAKARMTTRNVQLCLSDLVASPELAVEYNKGPHGRNLYHIDVEYLRAQQDRLPPPTLKPASSESLSGNEASVTIPLKPASPSTLKPASPEPSSGPSPEPSGTGVTVPNGTAETPESLSSPGKVAKKQAGHARITAFYDGLKQHMTCCQLQIQVGAQDRQAIIYASAPPGDIARALIDLRDPHRGWGSDWLRNKSDKSVRIVCNNLNAWYDSELNPDRLTEYGKGRRFVNP